MKTGIIAALAVTAASVLMGCAAPSAGVAVSSTGESRVDNSSVARETQVSDLKLTSSGDLLKATALISSKVSAELHLQYRFSWFDPQGLAIETDGQSWQPLKLHGLQQIQVSSVAPNPQASRFELYVRRVISN